MTMATDEIDALLRGYPRHRRPLPAPQAALYEEEYRINRGVRGGALYRITAALESWMHRRIAAETHGGRLLELGAGTLNHLQYEYGYAAYDVVEPLPALLDAAPSRTGVTNVYRFVTDVPSEQVYDRIFSVAVLEHLDDLPRIVAAAALHLAPGGLFQAGIPAEGGLLWGLSWRLTTGIAYRLRTGLAYAPVMQHEHINSAADIIAILRYLFADVRVRWFPLPFRHLAFYGCVTARDPESMRCQAILQDR
jgi:SAM-dependent methyltransferase